MFIPWASMTCSLHMSSAVWRFMTVSPALKTERRVVTFMEFGWAVLTSWRFSLKLPRPLSPPSFTQISSEGMAPSCHVKPSSRPWMKKDFLCHLFNIDPSPCGFLLAEAKGPFLCYYVLPNNVLCNHLLLAFTGYASVERFEPSTDTYLVVKK